MDKSYGITNQVKTSSALDQHLEEIKLNGFTILKDILNPTELNECRKRLDTLNEIQANEFSMEVLKSINELNMVRCPLVYDGFFLKIATNQQVNDLVKILLGDYYILHLQNGIINKPEIEHHQSSWHRDLPYQNFSITSPLALSALFCIDDFSELSGGTIVLPASHQMETVPSSHFIEQNKTQVTAPAGAVVLFDSMLLHKAGFNRSGKIRRGINNVYVKPILKQQINIPRALAGKYSEDPQLSKFLGYDSDVPDSVTEWRKNRIKKLPN